MMSDSGLTLAGLVIKRLDDVREDILTRLEDLLGRSVDRTDPRSWVSMIAGVLAAPIASVWSALQAVYDSFNLDNAMGAALDNLGDLLGTARFPATFAEVDLDLTGSPDAVIQSGKVVRVPDGPSFFLVDNVTLDGNGAGQGRFLAEERGAVSLAIGAISQIVTPTSGWSGVTNPTAIESGSDAELDDDYRVRIKASMQAIGSGTDGAIRAAMLRLPFITQARCLSNRTDAVVNGQPPKSFQVIVWPSGLLSDQEEEVARNIFLRQPSGMQAFGAEEFLIDDANGNNQPVAFSYATEVDVHVLVTLVVDQDIYPGDSAVEAAVLAQGEQARVGEDVFAVRFVCPIVAIAGVKAVSVLVGSSAPATEPVRLVIGQTSIARYDASRITVSTTAL